MLSNNVVKAKVGAELERSIYDKNPYRNSDGSDAKKVRLTFRGALIYQSAPLLFVCSLKLNGLTLD